MDDWVSACRNLEVAGSVWKMAALRTWEMRYERGCVCGGQWRLDTTVHGVA